MSAALDERPSDTLTVEGFGKLPPAELRAFSDGTIEFRYQVECGTYPGFDGIWRIVSEAEQREHLRMGGQVAEWLRSLESRKKGSQK